MATPTVSPNPINRWRRIAPKAILGGASFAVTLCLILGAVVWYFNRPEPPQPWNTNAIIAKQTPYFDASKDGKRVELRYVLENTSTAAYLADHYLLLLSCDPESPGPFKILC